MGEGRGEGSLLPVLNVMKRFFQSEMRFLPKLPYWDIFILLL